MNEMVQGDFTAFIGKTEQAQAVIDPETAARLAATLDLDWQAQAGADLPPAWHWLWFNPYRKACDLGPDGHPKVGGFLPDTGLPRRMWAGGRLTYHGRLTLGEKAEKTSEIIKISDKTGKAGRLVFVTLRHQIHVAGALRIEEEQDIVYREAALKGAAPVAAPPIPAPEGALWTKTVTPDPVLLFRYSALTSNGHRIHYDKAYAQEEEAYPDLVVHGPLTATLLQAFAESCRPEARLRGFSFRGMAPLFVSAPFKLQAKPGEAGAMSLWALTPEGGLAMQAEATFDA